MTFFRERMIVFMGAYMTATGAVLHGVAAYAGVRQALIYMRERRRQQQHDAPVRPPV
jgi:hypothetical protein